VGTAQNLSKIADLITRNSIEHSSANFGLPKLPSDFPATNNSGSDSSAMWQSLSQPALPCVWGFWRTKPKISEIVPYPLIPGIVSRPVGQKRVQVRTCVSNHSFCEAARRQARWRPTSRVLRAVERREGTLRRKVSALFQALPLFLTHAQGCYPRPSSLYEERAEITIYSTNLQLVTLEAVHKRFGSAINS
jgi:hypothetical protein